MAEGGRAQGLPAGTSYVDVGTLNGYRDAIGLLGEDSIDGHAATGARPGLGMPGGRAFDGFAQQEGDGTMSLFHNGKAMGGDTQHGDRLRVARPG